MFRLFIQFSLLQIWGNVISNMSVPGKKAQITSAQTRQISELILKQATYIYNKHLNRKHHK